MAVLDSGPSNLKQARQPANRVPRLLSREGYQRRPKLDLVRALGVNPDGFSASAQKRTPRVTGINSVVPKPLTWVGGGV
jgi:hypothetical protein